MLKDNAKLNQSELNQVAGGTVKEYKELIEAGKGFFKFQAHIPGVNRVGATNLEDFMRDKMGIEAHISLGAVGTGLFSKHNKYKDLSTGRSISHNEVLERLRKFVG